LKRAVQRYLQDPLAERLLQGEVPDGSILRIDEGDGELRMEVEIGARAERGAD
jgi:ATP-dependent Clp protease ATP-binding subunit ClpB